MERKQKRREMIDEDYIRNLIGGVMIPAEACPETSTRGIFSENPASRSRG